jgi:hypothetical protein
MKRRQRGGKLMNYKIRKKRRRMRLKGGRVEEGEDVEIRKQSCL